MQVISKNENKRNNSERASAVGVDIICVRESRYLGRKCNKGLGNKSIKV